MSLTDAVDILDDVDSDPVLHVRLFPVLVQPVILRTDD